MRDFCCATVRGHWHRILLFAMLHTFSAGDRSWLQAVQWSTLTLRLLSPASHMCKSSIQWTRMHPHTVTNAGFCTYSWCQVSVVSLSSLALTKRPLWVFFPKSSWNLSLPIYLWDDLASTELGCISLQSYISGCTSKILSSPCDDIDHGSRAVFHALALEGTEAMCIQQRFSSLVFRAGDFLRLRGSFCNMMHCRWHFCLERLSLWWILVFIPNPDTLTCH